MLNIDSPVQAHGLTLFRDYNDPGLYWYAPNSPRLAREGGQPLFQLLMYRRDITDNPDFREGNSRGGGFLTMTVDLAVGQGTLDSVAAELSSAVGRQVRLAPIPFENGTVRVTALGSAPATAGAAADGPQMVENILGSGRPSLYGDNRAVFSVELSTEGAQLLRASLEEDGASAIALVYELEYTGLRPAREVTIRIDYRQTYSYLHNKAVANTLWFKSDIDSESERMIQSGKIKIEDVNYLELAPAEAATRAQELNALAKELAQWTFFKPALKPGEVLAKDRGDVKIYDPTADAQANTAGFTTPLDLMGGGRNREGDGPVINAAATSRTGGVRGADAAATTPGAGTAETPTTTPGSPPASSSTPREPTAVERWNRAGRPQAGFMMKELSQSESQTIEYNLRQVSAHKRTMVPQGSIRLLAGDSQLAGRIRSIDLDDPFWQRVTGEVSTSADLAAAGVTSMVVSLRYGVRDDGSAPKDTAEIVLRRKDDKGSYAFFMDRGRRVELEFKITVNFAADFAIGDQKLQAESAWIKTTTRNLDIDPRMVRSVLPVRVVAGQVDWDAVKSLQTTISYRDPDHRIDAARTVVLSRSDSAAVVPVRPVDPEKLAYVVTSTYFYDAAQETVEETRSRGTDVVLNQPPSKAVPISVSAVDPLHRLSKVTVEFLYEPGQGGVAQRKLLSLTSGESQSWSFFRASATAEPKYKYRATQFGADGTVDEGPWIETTERQLIVGDRFPGRLAVEVQIIGDLAAAGIQLGRLVLEYPGVPAGMDGRMELAIRDAATPIHWTVPSKTREPGEYKWTVTWIRRDRTTTVESGVSRDEILLLFTPAAG